jgi:SET domain-containing protein 6
MGMCRYQPAGADAADAENTCEMVVNAAITPGSEIFNTYGSKLTNAELLVRYGFMLGANDNDVLTWTTEEIWGRRRCITR